MTATPVLYSYWRSSASWRVRIALHLKGIEYDYRAVHLVKDGGEQHGELYRAMNPAGLLPALEIDGLVLTESLAIIAYLDETRPDPPLMPAAPADRAQARRLAELVNAGIQPLQNLRVMQRLGERFGADAEGKAAWSRAWISDGLAAFETMVRPSAGLCCVGDTVSVADLCLVPQLYNARRFGMDVGAYPTIARIETALNAMDAFQRAVPERQPDAQ